MVLFSSKNKKYLLWSSLPLYKCDAFLHSYSCQGNFESDFSRQKDVRAKKLRDIDDRISWKHGDRNLLQSWYRQVLQILCKLHAPAEALKECYGSGLLKWWSHNLSGPFYCMHTSALLTVAPRTSLYKAVAFSRFGTAIATWLSFPSFQIFLGSSCWKWHAPTEMLRLTDAWNWWK